MRWERQMSRDAYRDTQGYYADISALESIEGVQLWKFDSELRRDDPEELDAQLTEYAEKRGALTQRAELHELWKAKNELP